MSHTPYLIHESSIAPQIASSGVLLVVESLCVEICSYTVDSACSWPLVQSIWLESSPHVRYSSFHPSSHVTYQSQRSVRNKHCPIILVCWWMYTLPCICHHQRAGCSLPPGLCGQSPCWTGIGHSIGYLSTVAKKGVVIHTGSTIIWSEAHQILPEVPFWEQF